MCVNHKDKSWWKAFCMEVKKAFRKNDFRMKVELYDAYERQMDRRFWREYYHYKRIDFENLKAQGKISNKTDFFDWVKENPG